MDIGNMLNQKGAAAAAAAIAMNPDVHQLQHLQAHPGHAMSESTSDRANSPHGSEHSRYSSVPSMNHVNAYSMNGGMRYPSPTAMQTPLPMLQGYRQDNNYDNGMMQHSASQMTPQQSSSDQAAQKAFPCSTCGKGFARRSDLARHERIHSGIRPHVCDYPGCGKQFIQRSALTVHARVHTGEKPHMCERCGKPFSDSSSLARHRRIHSGKRPYKCPYADCQKTFTRRTTLTRHQNHHTGTVEEAAAATAAALATRTGGSRNGRAATSDGEQYSQNGSPMSTPSPMQRNHSISPNSALAPLNAMHRNDYSYMSNSSLPVHLRDNYHHMQQQSQIVPVTSSYTNGMRPTSHPNPYGPPPILEPPTNAPNSGSATNSPHMGTVGGWNSPAHMASPAGHNNGYVYPDPVDPYGAQVMGHMSGHMYYPNSNIRRPQSTEPDNYDPKPRMQHEMWATAS